MRPSEYNCWGRSRLLHYQDLYDPGMSQEHRWPDTGAEDPFIPLLLLFARGGNRFQVDGGAVPSAT